MLLRGKQESFDDTSFLVALRLRFRFLNFQGLYAVVLGHTAGGNANRRHNTVRDTVAVWLRKHTSGSVRVEQLILELAQDRGEARLDVVAYDATGARMLLDVAVVHAVSADQSRLARAALLAGAPARGREDSKRERYRDAVGLVPFVLETGGRVGEAARAMARHVAPTDPAERTQAISDLWRAVAVDVQKANAIMLLTFGGP